MAASPTSTAESRTHEKYERLIARAKALSPIPTAVAHPCDVTSLTGAIEAAEAGIIVPILVGPDDKMRAAAEEAQLNIRPYEVVPALTSS